MRYLLDNSALIAWLLSQHQHNSRVLAWEKDKDLAICPLTELGFLRVACQAYGVSMVDARKTLLAWKKQRNPRFIPCDLSALEGIPAVTGKATTDYYFCNLAAKYGMKWATLDQHCTHPVAEAIV